MGARLPTCSVLLAAAAVAAPSRAAPMPEHGAELPVVWVNLSGLRPGAVRAAMAHAGRLLEPAAIQLAAKEALAGEELPGRAMTIVLCRERPAHGRSTIAGATAADGGRVVWVYPRRVATMLLLDPSVPHAWSAAGELAFRRMLGVVVAHELLHRLAGAAHAAGGVMTARLGCRDAGLDFRVPPPLFLPLRAGVARLAAGLPPLAPSPVGRDDPPRVAADGPGGGAAAKR